MLLSWVQLVYRYCVTHFWDSLTISFPIIQFSTTLGFCPAIMYKVLLLNNPLDWPISRFLGVCQYIFPGTDWLVSLTARHRVLLIIYFQECFTQWWQTWFLTGFILIGLRRVVISVEISHSDTLELRPIDQLPSWCMVIWERLEVRLVNKSLGILTTIPQFNFWQNILVA